MVQTKHIRTRINEKWLDETGVLRMRVLDGAHIDLESLLDDHKMGLELTGDKKVYAIYDASHYFTITPEARDYLNKGVLNENRLATAVITNNLAVRLLVNFINRFKHTSSALKMFSNETDALKWINELKVRNTELIEP